MFEGWAADVLASYLGKYLDLPRDRLRISLWGGALQVLLVARSVSSARAISSRCGHPAVL
jgi:hypothetical protein